MSGDQLRKLRQGLRLKQSELGEVLDVSERGIRRWENGEIKIPKIAEFALLHLAEKQRKRGNR